jgi:hypothetical protein
MAANRAQVAAIAQKMLDATAKRSGPPTRPKEREADEAHTFGKAPPPAATTDRDVDANKVKQLAELEELKKAEGFK